MHWGCAGRWSWTGNRGALAAVIALLSPLSAGPAAAQKRIIYDFVTDTPVGPVPSVEWIGMRNGKIKSVRLNFHSLEWPAIREEALRRAKVATATPAP
jgi:hypothetical protein